MPKIEPFEQFPMHYDEWFNLNQLVYVSEIRAVRELLPGSKKSIEIGVGSGRFAVPLGIPLGLEPSIAMGKIAHTRGIKIILGVAEMLPFRNNQFDFVLMVTTICFLDNVQKAFTEAFRVLKPGGYILVAFIDKDSPIGMGYVQHKNENPFYRIATFYSVPEIVQQLREIGFTNFQFIQTVFNSLYEITKIEPVRSGYGDGSFVVIRAQKE